MKGVCGIPPVAAGIGQRPIISMNSMTEPGQPCVRSRGIASGSGERTWMKWTRAPPMLATYWGNPFNRASCLRQS